MSRRPRGVARRVGEAQLLEREGRRVVPALERRVPRAGESPGRAVPLAQEHLPTQAATTSPLTLLTLRDLQSVNRIAAGQKLTFSPITPVPDRTYRMDDVSCIKIAS